jgi:hypothetical protein
MTERMPLTPERLQELWESVRQSGQRPPPTSLWNPPPTSWMPPPTTIATKIREACEAVAVVVVVVFAMIIGLFMDLCSGLLLIL